MSTDPNQQPPNPYYGSPAPQQYPPPYGQPAYPPPYSQPVYPQPAYPPPPAYYAPVQYAPAPPTPPSDTPWGAIVFGMIGGLIALIGAILPWISFQTCTEGIGFFRVCLPFALPGTFSVASYSSFLPFAAPMAFLFAFASLGLLFLNKPPYALVSAAVAAIAAVVGMMHIAIATPLLDEMSSELSFSSTTFSVTASIGAGPYVLIVGALLLFFAALIDWKLLNDIETRKAAMAQAAAPAGQAAPPATPAYSAPVMATLPEAQPPQPPV